MTAEHIPISVSICSNVPDFEEAHCIVEQDRETLVKAMLAYMTRIQSTAQALVQEKLSFVMQELESQLNTWNTEVDEKESFNAIMRTKIQNMIDEFEHYYTQIPVLGFNSAKYDINLIKRER